MQSNLQIVCAFTYGTWRAALIRLVGLKRHVLGAKGHVPSRCWYTFVVLFYPAKDTMMLDLLRMQIICCGETFRRHELLRETSC